MSRLRYVAPDICDYRNTNSDTCLGYYSQDLNTKKIERLSIVFLLEIRGIAEQSFQ